MALRDQPYLPLYVQDFLTDEKLNACKPSSQGVYTKIMCIFHKCDPYGGILLKQKDKQSEDICLNFAIKLANLLPFNLPIIHDALIDLLDEKVLQISGDFLYQKRMVKDNEISEKRSKSGSSGGKKTQSKFNDFALAKIKQNTEYEIEIENENEDINGIEEKRVSEKKETQKRFIPPTIDEVIFYCNERRNNVDPQKWFDFYSSKGWMIGKNKMKDWKAGVRTWENNQSTIKNGTGQQKQHVSSNSNSGVSDDYKRSILERLQYSGG